MGADGGLAFRLLLFPTNGVRAAENARAPRMAEGEQGMSISGIGGAAGTGAQQKSDAGKVQSPEETFLACMKKSPVERWVDSWLSARGLTKDAFDKLPPDEREALAKEMAEDLKKSGVQKRV